MELAQILAGLAGAVFVVLIFYVPAEILHKAGFSRWYALLMLIPPVGLVGLAIFAFTEWPVERELAWLRLKSGEPTADTISLVERHAVELERRGEWKKAAEVYTKLSQKAPLDENAEYYRNCVDRLKEHLNV